MKISSSTLGISLSLMLGIIGCSSPPPGGGPMEEAVSTPLQDMVDQLTQSEAVAYRAHEFMDLMTEDGQIVQLDSSFRVQLQRPGTLKVEADSGELQRQLWIADGQLTALDLNAKSVARAPAPGTLDEVLDHLAEAYGLSFPGMDFLYGDPLAIIKLHAQSSTYNGKTTFEGDTVHQLAFQAPGLDWQLWVSDTEIPLPRRFVMVQTTEPGRPHYEAILKDWSFEAAEGEFAPVIPDDFQEVTIDELAAAWEEQL